MASTVPLASVAEVVQIVGFAVFFAGVAMGTLLVFTDRHRYLPPVPRWTVGVAIAVGAVIIAVGWVGLRIGF